MFKLSWLSLTMILMIITLSQANLTQTHLAGIPPLPIVGEIGENAQAVDVEGDYAYVGFEGEFAVINITDKEHPQQIGSISVTEEITVIYVENAIAYLALQNELIVVDVSQPNLPIQRDTWLEPLIRDLKINGEFAFLLAGTNLLIFDVSNPDNILEVSRHEIEPMVFPTDLLINNNYAFATKYGGTIYGTWVLNISNPANPVEEEFWPLVDGPRTAIRDNFFYNAYGNCIMPNVCPAVFVSYDISDFSNPTKINIVQSGNDFIRDMELEWGYAYTGSRTQLQIFALGPAGDAFLGHSFSAEEIQDVAVEDGYVYLAAEPGLQIVLGPPYNPGYLPVIPFQK